MYIVIFDKTGDTKLSGWHYEKLNEFDAEWIQKSVVRIDNSEEAVKFAGKLQEFDVEKIKMFKAYEVTGEL